MEKPRRVDMSGPHAQILPNGDTLTFARSGNFEGVWMNYWTAGDLVSDPYRKEELTYDEYEVFRQQHPEFNMPELKPRPPATDPQGNTQGRVIGEMPASSKAAEDSNASVEAETAAEHETGDKILDDIQTGLDIVGLIPVVGEVADLVNAGVSLARGDYIGAGLSLIAAIPFAGWLGTAGKVARRGTKIASETSAKAAREAVERTAKKAAKEKTAKELAEKKAKEEAARKQNSGGQAKKNKTREKGNCGEWLAKIDLLEQGFDEIVSIQNNSGHGVDLIGRNSKTGEVKVWEVKTTDGPVAGKLSKAQRKMGGKRFTENRSSRAAVGQGNYGKLPKVRSDAKKARRWISRAGEKVSYEKREVFIDDIEKGCMKHPTRQSRSKPWQNKLEPL